MGGHLVVVHLREADTHTLADRLEDRLRAQVETAVHRAAAARRAAAVAGWRDARRRKPRGFRSG
ncbi:hypothetical protein [Streptomyces canus]|uniref:hypothetical protein n=1 Tax=Streptomyces canus TaxID=58343 RepID=UPI00325520E5